MSAPAAMGYAGSFEGIAGHSDVLRLLGRSLESGRIPHALLFHGPEGVGKGTVADRLARALTCTGEARRPCGLCPPCHRAQSGNSFDILRIQPDGAQIKVEQVRALIENLYGTAQRRVVILDTADAMNESAANALLKTLEEPPEGWVFLLVTARPEKVLPTIRSRCQSLRFSLLAEPDVRQVLEAAGIAPDQLPLYTAIAQGAPGRALEMDGTAFTNTFAEAVQCVTPEALASPGRVFAAAEHWGREPETARSFILSLQMWTSAALGAVCGAGTRPWLAERAGTDPAAWGAKLGASVLAELGIRLEESYLRLERNVSRQMEIESLLFHLREAFAKGGAVAASGSAAYGEERR